MFDSGESGLWHVLGQDTSSLTVPLFTQVYKWALGNLMSGVTLQWTSIQSRGNRHTPSRFLLLKLDESLGSYANFTCCPGYPFSVYAVSIKVYWIYTKCPTRHFMHHLSQNLQFHSRAAKCFGARKIQMMDFLRVYKHVSL